MWEREGDIRLVAAVAMAQRAYRESLERLLAGELIHAIDLTDGEIEEIKHLYGLVMTAESLFDQLSDKLMHRSFELQVQLEERSMGGQKRRQELEASGRFRRNARVAP